MKSFSIIVAATRSGGIGQHGHIPWRLPKDMAYFKHITTSAFRQSSNSPLNAVLMGRKTWESIPEKFRPLPGRINLVLTRHPDTLRSNVPSNVQVFSSLQDALDWVNNAAVQHLFVIGGSEVYKEALTHPNCEYLFLTRVHSEYDCDVTFPLNTPVFDLSKPEAHSNLESIAGQEVLCGNIMDQETEIQFQMFRRQVA